MSGHSLVSKKMCLAAVLWHLWSITKILGSIICGCLQHISIVVSNWRWQLTCAASILAPRLPADRLHACLLVSSQSVLLLGSVALLCLGLDLLFLLFYSFWLCCRRRKSNESSASAHHTHSRQPSADCCCTAWCVIIATLVCR